MKKFKINILLNLIIAILSCIAFCLCESVFINCGPFVRIVSSISQAVFVTTILSYSYSKIDYQSTFNWLIFEYWCCLIDYRNKLSDILSWTKANHEAIEELLDNPKFQQLCDENYSTLSSELKLDDIYKSIKIYSDMLIEFRIDVDGERYKKYLYIQKTIICRPKSPLKQALMESNQNCKLFCFAENTRINQMIQDFSNSKFNYISINEFYSKIIAYFKNNSQFIYGTISDDMKKICSISKINEKLKDKWEGQKEIK